MPLISAKRYQAAVLGQLEVSLALGAQSRPIQPVIYCNFRAKMFPVCSPSITKVVKVKIQQAPVDNMFSEIRLSCRVDINIDIASCFVIEY